MYRGFNFGFVSSSVAVAVDTSAPVYDAYADGTVNNGSSIPSFNINIGSGGNAAVIVSIRSEWGSASVATAAADITVTVGGNSATLISGATGSDQGFATNHLFGVAMGSATGNQAVVVSWTSGNAYNHAVASSFTGVDQTTPFDNGNARAIGYAATSSTLSITSESGDLTFSDVGEKGSTESVTVNNTQRYSLVGADGKAVGSTADGAASVDHVATISTESGRGVHVGCNINAVSGGSGASLIPTEIVSDTTGNGITDISIDASGATEGYLMILFVTMWANKDVSSYPASWTREITGKEGNSSGQSRLIAYTKIAAASETSYTFTVNGNLYGNRFAYSLLEIPANGLEVMQSDYSTGAVLGQLYGFATNSLHLALCGKADGSATEDVIHPTGYTELLDRTGSLHNHAVAYKEISAGGSASSGSDEFTDPDNSNTTGENNLSTIHLSVAAAGSALSVHPTASMTLDYTYSTIGAGYTGLNNATAASAKVTCNFDKSDTGIIMEHGATGYGLMLYIYDETLYFQCGQGSTAGSDADTGEVSYALTNSTAQDFTIEWSADVSSGCALYVNKVFAGRDSFSTVYICGSNHGTIGTGYSSVCANRGSYPTSNNFTGTVTSAEIFIGEVTYHV